MQCVCILSEGSLGRVLKGNQKDATRLAGPSPHGTHQFGSEAQAPGIDGLFSVLGIRVLSARKNGQAPNSFPQSLRPNTVLLAFAELRFP